MTKAIHARRRGDDFQAYCFWKRVCRMLLPDSDIQKVGFELNGGYTAFDDVAVVYKNGRPWRDGIMEAEYIQVKYSVGYDKAITLETLLDPGFINATSVSLMQRLRDAVTQMQKHSRNHCFVLLAPWQLERDDVLAKLYRREDGGLNVDRLFDGTTIRGEMGKVRKRLVDHLDLADEEELRPILDQFRIAVVYEDLQQIREELWRDINAAGLRPFDLSSMTDEYCQLPWRLHQQGTNWFTADTLRDIAQREHLFVSQRQVAQKVRLRLGIRTFMRWAEDMEAQTDQMLCLVQHFAGRHIHDESLWSSSIIPEVQDFLKQNVQPNSQVQLDIQAIISSIAFLTGYLVEPKLGADVALLQRGSSEPWTVRPSLLSRVSNQWSINRIPINEHGSDLALAVGVTHDIGPEVAEYVRDSLPGVREMVAFTPPTGASQAAIRNGTEAFGLAQSLVNHVRMIHRERRISGINHVFIAGPNGFTFYLGQSSRLLGRCKFYEYNFDHPGECEYCPSVTVDPTVAL